MELLRIITAGSVDDGKSTLIGRLLYDSKAISLDILEAIERSSKNKENGAIDLALLTDGLRAEREQGITIDVAYKYFTTENRKFIIADTPGHIQYTRNMFTGASNANLAVILVDARNGILEQTNRHSLISSLLGIPYLVVCINKIDMVNYAQDVFDKLVDEYKIFAKKLSVKEIVFIPVSAKFGDNIVEKSKSTNWYTGPTLLNYLEKVKVVENEADANHGRFVIQNVIRPQTPELPDYRGYAGKVISGVYKKGDTVTIYPSGIDTRIKSIEQFEKEIDIAVSPMPVIFHLEDEIDISRGDYIVKQNNGAIITKSPEAIICWMDENVLTVGAKLLLQHHSSISKVIVKEILYTINVNTFEKNDDYKAAKLNTICRIALKSANLLVIDDYKNNRSNGRFILIDENTNNTVAAGIFSVN